MMVGEEGKETVLQLTRAFSQSVLQDSTSDESVQKKNGTLFERYKKCAFTLACPQSAYFLTSI
jgi:hypothetical protein